MDMLVRNQYWLGKQIGRPADDYGKGRHGQCGNKIANGHVLGLTQLEIWEKCNLDLSCRSFLHLAKGHAYF
jgi:hypothetical protein